MEDTPPDRVERDAQEIADAANDAKNRREAQLQAEHTSADLKAEIASLQEKEREVEASGEAARAGLVDDDKRIEAAERDMREAIGGEDRGGTGSSPGTPATGGNAPGTPPGPPSQAPTQSANPPRPSSPPSHRPVG